MTITGAEALPPAALPAKTRRSLARSFDRIGRPPRVMGLDIARGVAILGMAAAHMASTPELNWADPTSWAALVHGRSAVLFALLAGVSTALLTGRTSRPTAEELPAMRARLVRRGIAIFVIGLVLELLATNIAIILCVYGVLFLCAAPVLRWRVRSLVIGSLVMALFAPLVMATVRTLAMSPFGPGVSLVFFGVYPVPVWLAFMLAGLAIGRCRLDTVKVASVILGLGVVVSAIGYTSGAFAAQRLETSDSAALGADSSGSSSAEPTGTYDDTPGDDAYVQMSPSELADQFDELSTPDMTCDVLPGQWFNCYQLTIPDAPAMPDPDDGYWARLTAGTPVHDVLSSALAVTEHSGGTPEILGSGGFAMAVLGLCLLLARPLRWLLLPVACLGMMPLTTYSAHVVVYLLLEGGPGGYFDATWAIWGWTVGGLAVFAMLWTVLFGRGPLERLLARVSRPVRGVPALTAPDAAPVPDAALVPGALGAGGLSAGALVPDALGADAAPPADDATTDPAAPPVASA